MPPNHRNVRDAILDELIAVDDEAVPGIHLDQVGLGVECAWMPPDVRQRRL